MSKKKIPGLCQRDLNPFVNPILNEAWASLLEYSTGIKKKPFQDKAIFGHKNLINGFKATKPLQFIECDNFLLNAMKKEDQEYLKWFIQMADNRMMMGDYRYGAIYRQNLDGYNTINEFYRRLKHANKTLNLEYIIDAYNMFRIEVFKRKSMKELLVEKHKIFFFIRYSYKHNWKLTSIDDGIHAEEQ